jgi:hypothetical protein
MADEPGYEWCECPDAPVTAKGPLTLLDHSDDCGFPARQCDEPVHQRMIHETCGRPVKMRFCCCGGDYGFALDPERGWWVHYNCGWPTRAWFTGSGSPAPADLAGLKPITWHPFEPVPRSPKTVWLRLSEAQRALNLDYLGRWVRDLRGGP